MNRPAVITPAAVNGRRAPPFGMWERMLASRYLRAKRSQGGVALISIISFVGIMLAVAVLIIVMSVMNGFRTELLGRILGFQGHAFVAGGVLDGPALEPAVQRILTVPGVVQAVPVVQGQVLAMSQNQITGAIVRGISARDVAGMRIIANNVTHGSLASYGKGDYGGDAILLGDRLAESLGVRVGDPLTLVSPSGGATAFGAAPVQKTFTVAGTFTVGMSQYDQAYIYMPLQQAQLFFGREGTVDEIEIKLANPDQVTRLKPRIAQAAGPTAIVTDWTQRDTSFWGALKVERAVMRLILMLLVAIAALNIISGLVMLVKNKGRDIAILRTMGAGQGSILRIFVMAGGAVGVLGTIAGLLIGSLFCIYIDEIQGVVEWVTGQQVFASDVYFLAHIPAKVDWVEVTFITLFAMAMSFLATLPPAWRASRLDPVEALRYE
jgi:lipoprotein-releasing system permease protein